MTHRALATPGYQLADSSAHDSDRPGSAPDSCRAGRFQPNTDPQRQIAVDPAGAPLGPQLAKDWTSTEGTHTDGDGGDNENWGWKE